MGDRPAGPGPSAPADWCGSSSVANLAGVMQAPGRFPQHRHAARVPRIASGGGGRGRPRTRAPGVSLEVPLCPRPSGLLDRRVSGGVSSGVPPVHRAESATSGRAHSPPGRGAPRRRSLGGIPSRLWGPAREHAPRGSCRRHPPHSAPVPHAVGSRERMEKLSHGVGRGFCRGWGTESGRASREGSAPGRARWGIAGGLAPRQCVQFFLRLAAMVNPESSGRGGPQGDPQGAGGSHRPPPVAPGAWRRCLLSHERAPEEAEGPLEELTPGRGNGQRFG